MGLWKPLLPNRGVTIALVEPRFDPTLKVFNGPGSYILTLHLMKTSAKLFTSWRQTVLKPLSPAKAGQDIAFPSRPSALRDHRAKD
jgi:hypothetical protein